MLWTPRCYDRLWITCTYNVYVNWIKKTEEKLWEYKYQLYYMEKKFLDESNWTPERNVLGENIFKVINRINTNLLNYDPLCKYEVYSYWGSNDFNSSNMFSIQAFWDVYKVVQQMLACCWLTISVIEWTRWLRWV